MATLYISVPPTIQAEAGKSFTVPVTVNMYGVGHALSVKVEVEFNGQTYERTSTLSGDGSHTINVNIGHAPGSPGDYRGRARAYYFVSGENPWQEFGSAPFTVKVRGEENPVISWEVSAPDKVNAGDTVTVTVKAYVRRTTTLKAEVSLFGTTKSKQFTAYSSTTPGVASFTFAAPSREDRYTGEVTLYAYY